MALQAVSPIVRILKLLWPHLAPVCCAQDASLATPPVPKAQLKRWAWAHARPVLLALRNPQAPGAGAGPAAGGQEGGGKQQAQQAALPVLPQPVALKVVQELLKVRREGYNPSR